MTYLGKWGGGGGIAMQASLVNGSCQTNWTLLPNMHVKPLNQIQHLHVLLFRLYSAFTPDVCVRIAKPGNNLPRCKLLCSHYLY